MARPTDVRSPRRGRLRPVLESLEGRDLPASLLVTTAADSGVGSLRQAILDANATTAEADTVTFAGGLSGQTILLATSLPTVTDDDGLTITGPGRKLLTITGNDAVRAIDVASGALLTVMDLTITHGKADGSNGGAVRNQGTLFLTNVDLTASKADRGGAFSNEVAATATLDRVNIQGNQAVTSAGGVHNQGTLRIFNSAVLGNTSAGTAGGVENVAGTLDMTNTTVNGNSALGGSGGGGVKVLGGSATLVNVTITGNEDSSGNTVETGGLSIVGTATVRNSVIAQNTGDGAFPDVDPATLAVDQTNFIGNRDGNPQLGALTDNGGPTLSIKPLAGSPLINAGTTASVPVGVVTDQRGFLRIVGPSVDIGAIEFQPAGTLTVTTSPNPSAVGQKVAVIATIAPGGPAPNNLPSGTVIFTIDGVEGTAQPVVFNNGAAVLNTAFALDGQHTITAHYFGDGNYPDSVSAPATHTVTLSPPPPPVNTPPTITLIANQTVEAGQSTAAIPFIVNDAQTAPAALVVTAQSSNPTLVPLANIVLGGTGADRTVTITPVAGLFGSTTITLTVSDGSLASATTFIVTVAGTGTPTRVFAAGSGDGSPAEIKLYNADALPRLTLPVSNLFTGGMRTATADFNGDGFADVVAGFGPGLTPQVTVFDGKSGDSLGTFVAFEASFTGGVFVAVADFNADGIPDIAVSPDVGGGPRVRVVSGKDFSTTLADFFGIEDPAFRGGARVAAGDINGDGRPDLVVAAGISGGPRVAGFDGSLLAPGNAPPKLFADFFVFEDTLRNGVFVAAGDLNGDGFAEVIAGGGPGGGPRVFALSGIDLLTNTQTQAANFFAGNPENRGGIRVAAKDLDGDGRDDLVTGAGTGDGSRVTGYLGIDIPIDGTPTSTFAFDAFSGFTGGVFVG